MKYGQYIQSKIKEEWRQYYLDYKGLKDLIEKSAQDAASSSNTTFSPRTTSLTVQRYAARDTAEEQFFAKLEQDVLKVNKFTQQVVDELRAALKNIQSKDKASLVKDKDALLKEADRIGDKLLDLEKFVNINYMGFHKILKKHDKLVPHAPCRQFYIAHLHQQPWVQGNYSDLLVGLSAVYSLLRGDASGQKNEDAAQGFVRSTTKFWVRTEDASAVKRHILQHLPVFQFEEGTGGGDAQLLNSVYLDNSSMELYHGRLDKRPGALAVRLRWYGNSDPTIVFVERKTHRESWKGEESVKERFVLKENRIVPFLDGDYKLAQAVEDLKTAGKSEREISKFSTLFSEIYNAIDSKQLRPLVRTQYMRTAFQIPFDSTVRISLDTNLVMIKENPDDGPTCAASGRWYRDPNLAISRREITRFPHAVLEVKLSLREGQTAPSWVSELLDSGYLTEVHKFSKFIHGTATLFPDMVRAVPYWVDDESIRASMLASAPQEEHEAQSVGTSVQRTAHPPVNKPRPRRADRRNDDDELSHPLLGEAPTLKLMPDPEDVPGFGAHALARPSAPSRREPGFFAKLLGLVPPPRRPGMLPQRIEPKTFFANERTFLSWLHMAITLASIAAAMLGFAAGSDSKDDDSAGARGRHLVALISLLLLPLACGICMYALFMFLWRATMIAKKQPTGFDDKRGPLVLCCAVSVTLIAILLLSVADFVEVYTEQNPAPGPTPAGLPPAALVNLNGFSTLPHAVMSRFLRIA